MRHLLLPLVVGLLTFIVSAALIVAPGLIGSRVLCKQQWERSGLPIQWTFAHGCQVQLHNGHWLPAEVYTYEQ